MRIACWNTEWHRAGTWQGRHIRSVLLDSGAELICCPEAHVDFLETEWHGMFSKPDYGYPIVHGRRKVALWSRSPWTAVDDLGTNELPSGRFVRGNTQTSLGPVHVVGICIPWHAAHVSSGRRDRRRWEDHSLYLKGLGQVLRSLPRHVPILVVGDFNQCMPRRIAPVQAFDELTTALDDLHVWTQGSVPGFDKFPVCHIAGSCHFALEEVSGYPRLVDGRAVSDHDGIAVKLSLQTPSH
jgi:endonuclease/exonuclease/phosphatase family metal-dependent hydrolase